MKDSVITLLNGIKAWGDARISRLREELQRRIIDAKIRPLRQSNLPIAPISASGNCGMAWMRRMSGSTI